MGTSGVRLAASWRGDVGDAHGIAHVEHEHLAVLADRAGLDDELHGLLDGHEVARHVGIGHGQRLAGVELGAERGEHRAPAPEHVAEPDAQEPTRLVAPVVRGQRLGDPLRVAERAAGVRGLVGGDVDEARDPGGGRGLQDRDRAPDVGLEGLGGVRLQQRQVLQRGGMEHHVGLDPLHRLDDAVPVADVGEEEVGGVEQRPSLDRELHRVEVRLVAVDHHEALGVERRDLAAQLRADRAAGAGDHHAPALDVLGHGDEVGLDRVPAEQVRLGRRPQVADVHVAVQQLVDRRCDADVQPREASRLAQLTDEGAVARRHRDDQRRRVRALRRPRRWRRGRRRRGCHARRGCASSGRRRGRATGWYELPVSYSIERMVR